MAARRGRIGWAMFLFFLVMPVIEVIVIIMVGRRIGGWQTLGLLVLWSVVGAWLVKRQWRTAWRGLRTALQTGKMPARELTDAALVLIGGALLFLPGFVTDVLGLLLVLPFTRPLARPLLQAAVARRVLAGSGVAMQATEPTYGSRPPHQQQDGRAEAGNAAGEEIIEGEIVDD